MVIFRQGISGRGIEVRELLMPVSSESEFHPAGARILAVNEPDKVSWNRTTARPGSLWLSSALALYWPRNVKS
jgi:hypothetical protein